MSEKSELPAELKAIEAELAALVPRTDEVDRERLIFLAGQASSQKKKGLRGARASGMSWPIATAAMTALAASLLVVLVTRPAPEVITKIVYLDQEESRPVEDKSVGRVEPEASPPDALPVEPDRWEDLPRSPALAWIDFPARDRVRREAGYLAQLDRMLDRRASFSADGLYEPTLRPPSSDNKRAAAPVTYHSLLDSLIETPKPRTDQPDSSAGEIPSFRGVDS